jgi:hypothetical protein
MNIDAIRKQLSNFVSYEDGQKLRQQLEEHSRNTYIPRHPDKYLQFMNKYECCFKRNPAQSQNHPYVWTMFSVPSQHVMGDCTEECLDKAMIKSSYV